MGPESAKLLPSEKKSDPICSSSGWCGPNIPPKPKPGSAEAEVLYPTDVPLDSDIKNSHKSLEDAEKKLGTWKYPPNDTKKALIQAYLAIKRSTNAINLNQITAKSAVKMQAKLMTK